MYVIGQVLIVVLLIIIFIDLCVLPVYKEKNKQTHRDPICLYSSSRQLSILLQRFRNIKVGFYGNY